MESRGRILFLRPVLDAYGVSKVIFHLADTLRHRGYHVIVASDNDDIFKRQLNDMGIRHYTIPLRPDKKNVKNFLSCSLRLSKIIKEENIDIIHSHHRWSSFISYFVSRKMKVPLVTTYHGIHQGKKWMSIWGDKVISVSEDAKRHLVEYFNVSPQMIEVIHNGVAIPEIPDDGEAMIRRTYLFAKPVIASVARMSPEKDHESLLLAMKKVLVKHPRARLLIVGNGPLEKNLRELSKELHIAGNVEFLGECEDVSEILRNIDLLVISSLTEGLPMAVLEALAFSKPVVATNVGDIPMVVINRQTGYTVTPRDPERLAEAINIILANRDIALILGRNGRKLVESKFSVEHMTNKNEKVYLEMLALT